MSLTAPIAKEVRVFTNQIVDITKTVRDTLSEAYLQVTDDQVLPAKEMTDVISGSIKYILSRQFPLSRFKVKTAIDERLTAETVVEWGKSKITMRATRQG